MNDADGPLTEAEEQRARDALAQRQRDLAAARESGDPPPRRSRGKFDGFAPGLDDDDRPYPTPPRDGDRS